MITRRNLGCWLAATGVLLARPGLAQAQDWPARAARVVVPYGEQAPAGATRKR